MPADQRPSEVDTMAYEVGKIAEDANQLKVSRENELYGSSVMKSGEGINYSSSIM